MMFRHLFHRLFHFGRMHHAILVAMILPLAFAARVNACNTCGSAVVSTQVIQRVAVQTVRYVMVVPQYVVMAPQYVLGYVAPTCACSQTAVVQSSAAVVAQAPSVAVAPRAEPGPYLPQAVPAPPQAAITTQAAPAVTYQAAPQATVVESDAMTVADVGVVGLARPLTWRERRDLRTEARIEARSGVIIQPAPMVIGGPMVIGAVGLPAPRFHVLPRFVY